MADGPPKCKTPGCLVKRHWSPDPHQFADEPEPRPARQEVARPESKPVTPRPVTIARPANVTPLASANVTPPANVTPRRLNIPDEKRGHRVRQYASDAERQRAYRARTRMRAPAHAHAHAREGGGGDGEHDG